MHAAGLAAEGIKWAGENEVREASLESIDQERNGSHEPATISAPQSNEKSLGLQHFNNFDASCAIIALLNVIAFVAIHV